ncbi:MAG: tetratricopeptide repeat protein [Candidatus Omnitrophica bacterium]|nr:tetratricopeptide repeat protein [Candidatus Omnitrophota bacterium]
MHIRSRTYILLILLIVVVVFSGSLRNGFVWDDKFLVEKNPYIKDMGYLPGVFGAQLYQGSGMHSDYYRPMQSLSYMVDYFFWKLKPFGYHLTSLLMHAVNSTLVYLVLMAVSFSSGLAFLGAIFFAIAPANSGITYYIAARADLLMACFLFLSFLFFSKYFNNKSRVAYIISIMAFALSLLSREVAIMLPALLMLDLHRRREKVFCRRTLKLLFPYLVILVIYAVGRFSILNFSEGSSGFINPGFPASIPLWKRVLTDFKIVPVYLRLLLFPHDLHMEWYIKPVESIFQANVIYSIILLSFLVFAIKALARKSRLVFFGAMWFLLCLLPVLNIYPISVLFGDGWLYVPSVGFFIMLCVFFRDRIVPKAGKKITVILAVCFIFYSALLTMNYSKMWKDTGSLLHNIVKYEEKSSFVYLTYVNLGGVHYDKGEYEKAIEYDKKAIKLNPKYAEAYCNLAVAYMETGRPIKAIGHFKRAIRLKKDYVSAYCFLSQAYSEIGLNDRAVEFSKMALELKPDSYDALCNMGYLCSDKGETDKAKFFYEKASMSKKEASAPHFSLGNLYMRNNEFKKALREYEEALRLGMDEDHQFYNELSVAYIKNNKYSEAEEMLLRSLALNSEQPGARNDLGNLYAMFGHFDLAFDEYKKALELDPEDKGILANVIRTKSDWKTFLVKHNDR